VTNQNEDPERDEDDAAAESDDSPGMVEAALTFVAYNLAEPTMDAFIEWMERHNDDGDMDLDFSDEMLARAVAIILTFQTMARLESPQTMIGDEAAAAETRERTAALADKAKTFATALIDQYRDKARAAGESTNASPADGSATSE